MQTERQKFWGELSEGHVWSKLSRENRKMSGGTYPGKCKDVSPCLIQLHWQPIRYRITYKLCTLMHNVHIGKSPRYLADGAAYLLQSDALRPALSL